MKSYIANKECFFIAKNPSYHYGKLVKGQAIDTGQAELQIFDTFDDWRSQLLTDNIISNELEYIDNTWSTPETISETF